MTNSINNDGYNQRMALYNAKSIGPNALSMQALPTAQDIEEKTKNAGEKAQKAVNQSAIAGVSKSLASTKELSLQQMGVAGATGLAISHAFVKLSTYLSAAPKDKEFKTFAQEVESSRIARLGRSIDAFIENNFALKKIQDFLGQANKRLVSIKEASPKFIQEILGGINKGAESPWAETARRVMKVNLTHTKQDEAVREFLDQLKNIPKDTLDMPKVKSVLKALDKGKITQTRAFELIDGMLKKVPAGKLEKIAAPGSGKLGILFGTNQNMQNVYNKVNVILKQNNNGIISRNLQKMWMIFTEAVGGGILGSKLGVLTQSLFLSMSVAAGIKADKGDGIKRFMEEFWGYMIFGYVAMTPITIAFNKLLGVTELGLDKNKIKELAKALNIKDEAPTLQKCVMEYNKQLKEFKKFRKIVSKYDTSGMFTTVEERNKKIVSKLAKKFKISADGKTQLEIISEVQKKLGLENSPLNEKTLKKTADALIEKRADLNSVWKTKEGGALSLKSIFKETSANPGKFFTRLGRYITQKPLAFLGKAVSVGRYTTLKIDGNILGNTFRRFKRVGGGIGRVALVGLVAMDFISQLGMKFSHMIFGKPKKSALDELNGTEVTAEKPVETSAQQPKSLEELLKPVQNKTHPLNAAKQMHTPLSEQSEDSFRKLYQQSKSNSGKELTSLSTQPAHTLPTAEDTKSKGQTKAKNEDVKDSYTYIPSSANVAGEMLPQGEQPEFSPRFHNIFKKADIAEANAMRFLQQ